MIAITGNNFRVCVAFSQLLCSIYNILRLYTN